MSLSCSCQEWEGDGWAFWLMNEEFEPFVGKRKKQCCSCGTDIVHLQPCLTFCRGRGPRNSVEEKIYGDPSDPCVPLAPYHMCEKCGETYLNLVNVGFCVDITDYMQHDLEDYHELTGFTKIEGKFGR